MYIYMCTILTYLRDSLTYMRQVAIHMTDYVDATTTNILSPDILPMEDLRNMLRHIESELPSTMHLPISLDDTLHFYQYPNTHILIADKESCHHGSAVHSLPACKQTVLQDKCTILAPHQPIIMYNSPIN